LDSCLIPSGVTNNNANNGSALVKVVAGGAGDGLGDKVDNNKEDDEGPKRPKLPSTYHRQVSINTSSWIPSTYPDPTCGYFLVERLAISIPTFLELYSSS
jgi:hypothetical protein